MESQCKWAGMAPSYRFSAVGNGGEFRINDLPNVGNFAVNLYVPLANGGLSCTAGTRAVAGKKFLNAHRRFHWLGDRRHSKKDLLADLLEVHKKNQLCIWGSINL
jgi:hypothetical protein